jgi:hypothetical protein
LRELRNIEEEHVCGFTPNAQTCNCLTDCFPCPLATATFWCWGSNVARQCNATVMAPMSFSKPSGFTNIPTSVIGAGFDHTAGFGSFNGQSDFAAFGGTIGCNANPAKDIPKQLVFTATQLFALETDGKVDAIGSQCTPTQTIAQGGARQIGAGTGFVCFATDAGSGSNKLFCTGRLDPVFLTNAPIEIKLP